jgi:hypothetical protein
MKKNILVVLALLLVITIGLVYYFGMAANNSSKVTQITKTAIPENLKTSFASLVKQKYPDWEIVNIASDPVCDGAEAYDIALKKPAGDKKSIIVDKNASLIQTEVDAQINTLPPNITNLLKSNYSKYTYGDSYEDLTMANGDKQYLIDITQDGGKTNAELILNLTGNVLCQTKAK